MILTAIDVGTNTIRLLVAEMLSRTQFRVLSKDRRVVRLGKGFTRERKIAPERLKTAIHVINTFAARARKFHTEKILLYGTSALREAENSKEAQKLLEKETGLFLLTISGEMEARLTSLGAIRTLSLSPKNVTVIDIGGGSSEFSFFPSEGPPSFLSFPVGAVRLTEKFLSHDPPNAEEYEQMYEFGYKALEKALSSFSHCLPDRIIGTGGTATTLAAIQQGLSTYEPAKINNVIVSLDTVKKMGNHLRSLSIRERGKIAGLEKGREDIILAGISLFIAFLKILKISSMTISDGGLLEGIIFQEINSSGL